MFELSWVTAYLAIGARPISAEAWADLKRSGVTLVIDLNDNGMERRQVDMMGLRYRGLRVSDPTEPEEFLAAFPKIHQWIENEQSLGGRVYLHCTAGQSRSPTCAMAYLMAVGKTMEQAKNTVRESHRPTWQSGDVETLERALCLWERRV